MIKKCGTCEFWDREVCANEDTTSDSYLPNIDGSFFKVQMAEYEGQDCPAYKERTDAK